MGRRGATLLLGAVLLLLLIWQAGTAPVPYVELGPGPTENTLGSHDGKPIITIDGRAETVSAGQLRLTTVNVRDNLTLLDAMRGWFSGDSAVAPREVVFPVRPPVTGVTKGLPAESVLKPGDVIPTVAGAAVTSSQKLRELIRAKPAGTSLQVGYTRAGVAAVAGIATATAEDGSPRLGVV